MNGGTTTSKSALRIEAYNSVGGAAFFRKLLQEWERAGATVSLHQAVSETSYRKPRGTIGRFSLRWQMYAGYAWRCWRTARSNSRAHGVSVVTTNPFFAPALVARATNGPGPTINLLYDLYPEALTQAGQIRDDGPVARLCENITRYALRNCAVTVFLGERLRMYAESKYGQARHSVVIPVGADGDPFKDHPPGLLALGERPQLLYSGQMGRMHEIETMLAGWGFPEAGELAWRFHASGAGYQRLQLVQTLPEDLVFGEGLSEEAWQKVMRQSHVALVTIAQGAERVVMPSKTYSALVAGQAVLAICPRASDLADLVTLHDCGWVVEPGDVMGLLEVLRRLVRGPGELLRKRQNAFKAGHQFYEMSVVANAWLRLFRELPEIAGQGSLKAGGPPEAKPMAVIQ